MPQRMQQAVTEGPQLCHGWVTHTRHRPREHRFAYRVFFLRVPLSAVARVDNRWCSRDRFNLLSFHARDYGPRDGSDPRRWVEAQLESVGLACPDGEIVLQTFPRVLGYVFNPISLWFCHARDGRVTAVVCEVSNTFGERHNYVVACDESGHRGRDVAKRFHVSPFCEVKGHYRFRFAQTPRHSAVHIDYYDRDEPREDACDDDPDGIGNEGDDRPLIATTLGGIPRPLTARSALAAFVSHPLQSFAVVARIHWHALALWRRHVPWFSKPAPPHQPTTL